MSQSAQAASSATRGAGAWRAAKQPESSKSDPKLNASSCIMWHGNTSPSADTLTMVHPAPQPHVVVKRVLTGVSDNTGTPSRDRASVACAKRSSAASSGRTAANSSLSTGADSRLKFMVAPSESAKATYSPKASMLPAWAVGMMWGAMPASRIISTAATKRSNSGSRRMTGAASALGPSKDTDTRPTYGAMAASFSGVTAVPLVSTSTESMPRSRT